jgi:hypothetical protein
VALQQSAMHARPVHGNSRLVGADRLHLRARFPVHPRVRRSAGAILNREGEQTDASQHGAGRGLSARHPPAPADGPCDGGSQPGSPLPAGKRQCAWQGVVLAGVRKHESIVEERLPLRSSLDAQCSAADGWARGCCGGGLNWASVMDCPDPSRGNAATGRAEAFAHTLETSVAWAVPSIMAAVVTFWPGLPHLAN